MRNKIKNIFLVIMILLLGTCLCPSSVNASEYKETIHLVTSNQDNSLHNQYYYYDYVIESYHVDIKVNEDNTFDITEKLSVYFNMRKHGIYRTIPVKNTVTRTDGTTTNIRAKISNLKVNDKYQKTTENNNLVIKIGDANKYLIGEKDYEISYTYDIGKDKLDNYDEFYYNIIGDEWDTVIGNVTFKITMPKEFDEDLLGFSSGYSGSTSSQNVTYTVTENVITGESKNVLSPYQGLTIRITLPEGYFVRSGYQVDWKIYVLFGLPIISLLIAIFLWAKYGKDDEVIETVEFYPPEGYNSLEVGYLYSGHASNEDVISLLVYLANKGYIRIDEEQKDSKLRDKSNFKVTKLKDYDGTNSYERTFLEGLFEKKRVVSVDDFFNKDINKEDSEEEELTTVTADDLENHFYKTVDSILHEINSKSNKKKIFESYTQPKTIIASVLAILTVFAIFMLPVLDYAVGDELGLMLLAVTIYIPFYMVGISKSIPLFFRLIWLGFTMIHSIIFMTFLPFGAVIMEESIFLVTTIVGLICVIGMVICIKNMAKRTKYGNEMLGKIKGFKRFLETAEKSRLETMVHTNPTYFYDILPYAYVLEVSDKWIEKFESIAISQPDWYYGCTGFDVVVFGSFMSSTISSVRSVSVHRSSGGGGFSGGGFSGGGSGGGGGGSW